MNESINAEHFGTLDQLAVNQTAKVISIDSSSSDELRNRLLVLGIYPGSQLQLLRRAPLGDPLQIKVDRALVSIRKVDAQAVRVIDDA